MAILRANAYFDQGSGIVTLCSPALLFQQCMTAYRLLTLKNWIVLMRGSWNDEQDSGLSEEALKQLKALHFHKLRNSEAAVIVTNKAKFIDEEMTKQIEFCNAEKTPVFYFDGEVFSGEINIPASCIPDWYSTHDESITKFF